MHVMKWSVGVLFAFASLATAEKCYKLEDKDAPLRSLPPTLGKYEDLFLTGMGKTILDFMPATLSTCLASYDGSKATELMADGIDLFAAIASLKEDKNAKAILDNMPSSIQDILLEYLATIKEENLRGICDAHAATLHNAITKLLVPLKTSLEKHSNGCCQPLFDDMKTNLGHSLESFVEKLSENLMNVLCSIRTPGFENQKDQTCVYTLIQVISGNVLGNVLSLIQLPNKSACGFFKGESVKSITGKEIFLSKEKGTIDSCSKPLDSLVTFAAAMPFLKKGEWRKLFAEGEAMEITKDMLKGLPSELVVFDGIKAHLANGYSASCEYETKVKSAVGDTDKDPADTGKDPADTGDKGGDKDNVATALTLGGIATIVSGALFFV